MEVTCRENYTHSRPHSHSHTHEHAHGRFVHTHEHSHFHDHEPFHEGPHIQTDEDLEVQGNTELREQGSHNHSHPEHAQELEDYVQWT